MDAHHERSTPRQKRLAFYTNNKEARQDRWAVRAPRRLVWKSWGAALSGSPAGASSRLSSQQLRQWLVRHAHRRSGAPGAGGAGDTGARGAAVTSRAGRTGGAGAGGARVGGTGAGGAGAAGAGAVDPGTGERRELASRPVSLVPTTRRAPRSRPPPVPGTHAMTLRPSPVPLRVPLPAPLESSLLEVPDPVSDCARAASPIVSRLLATAVTDPSFESAGASALVAELHDFAAACRLDYATAQAAESVSATPPSVGGECALGTDVLEDRKEDFECLAAAAAMHAEMASWKSTGTYIDEVPPSRANIVDGMWIFRVKRPPGFPPAFKARYIARGFSQRQGVDYFHTFSPTPKMTTLRVLLHDAAQRDYELNSLDFNTAFLQGSLHEEIWLRRPPVARHTEDYTCGSWVYSFYCGPVTVYTHPSLFLRTDPSLPPFYVLVYVDDLVFAIADTEALTLMKSELQKRHTCTDLGELQSYLGLQVTRDRARRTITLTQSHMLHQVLQCFGFQFSSPQPTPLSTSQFLSTPPLDESVEPSGPYPELVGCLMYLMTCARPDLAYPLSLLARYMAPSRHRKVHWDGAKRELRYLCSTSGMGLVLGGQGPVVLTGHADASWVDDLATQRSTQGYTFSLGSGSISWRSTRSSLVLSSSCEAEIYAGAMAAQELHWLTYLLTDLGEQPHLPPHLYVENKAMIALCQEHRLEQRTNHIDLRYFLARELQQRGQLFLVYVATRANAADIFTKALPPGDHRLILGLLVFICYDALLTHNHLDGRDLQCDRPCYSSLRPRSAPSHPLRTPAAALVGVPTALVADPRGDSHPSPCWCSRRVPPSWAVRLQRQSPPPCREYRCGG
ncbi:unnamed protein product [Closterium sp. NIES-54]